MQGCLLWPEDDGPQPSARVAGPQSRFPWALKHGSYLKFLFLWVGSLLPLLRSWLHVFIYLLLCHLCPCPPFYILELHSNFFNFLNILSCSFLLLDKHIIRNAQSLSPPHTQWLRIQVREANKLIKSISISVRQTCVQFLPLALSHCATWQFNSSRLFHIKIKALAITVFLWALQHLTQCPVHVACKWHLYCHPPNDHLRMGFILSNTTTVNNTSFGETQTELVLQALKALYSTAKYFKGPGLMKHMRSPGSPCTHTQPPSGHRNVLAHKDILSATSRSKQKSHSQQRASHEEDLSHQRHESEALRVLPKLWWQPAPPLSALFPTFQPIWWWNTGSVP